MKYINKYSLWVMLLSLTVLSWQGCKEDLSSLDVNKIEAVEIDTSGMPELEVFQFETLALDPEIDRNGIAEEDLSYEWFINDKPKSRNFIAIGESRSLAYQVSFPPTAPGAAHTIMLKVTDTRNDLEYITSWPLVIRNSIGEGIVIVETYDGTTTDISHVMSPLVTPNYDEEKVRHKVFSSVNGYTLPGLVRQLRFTSVQGSGSVLLGSTANSLFTIKTLDYTFDKENEELFYAPQDSYGAEFLGGIIQNDMMVLDGRFYSIWLAIGRYGLSFESPYRVPKHLAINAWPNPHIVTSFYSEEAGRFVYQGSPTQFGDRVVRPVAASTTGPFNPAAVPNKMNIAAGVTPQWDFLHLLKDKTSNVYALYILDKGDWYYDWDTNTGVTVPSSPKALVNLGAAPEIAQAEHFLLLDDQQVLLYATKTKIYAAIYSASTIRYELRYTAPAGEEITSLKVYQQADYPMRSSGNFFSRNNRQLIMGTYNGSEGKLSILPLINQGEAVIDVANIKTYGGFGRILLTTTQL